MIKKSSFEALQKRFNSIPIEMADDDLEGYIHLCDVILQEEGWLESEYLNEALKRKGFTL